MQSLEDIPICIDEGESFRGSTLSKLYEKVTFYMMVQYSRARFGSGERRSRSLLSIVQVLHVLFTCIKSLITTNFINLRTH